MIVCDYVPGVWQWDSPHIQVPDLQGGPGAIAPQRTPISPALWEGKGMLLLLLFATT